MSDKFEIKAGLGGDVLVTIDGCGSTAVVFLSMDYDVVVADYAGGGKIGEWPLESFRSQDQAIAYATGAAKNGLRRMKADPMSEINRAFR